MNVRSVSIQRTKRSCTFFYTLMFKQVGKKRLYLGKKRLYLGKGRLYLGKLEGCILERKDYLILKEVLEFQSPDESKLASTE